LDDWGDKAYRDEPWESLFTGMKGIKGMGRSEKPHANPMKVQNGREKESIIHSSLSSL